jgi:hypothetical protein
MQKYEKICAFLQKICAEMAMVTPWGRTAFACGQSRRLSLQTRREYGYIVGGGAFDAPPNSAPYTAANYRKNSLTKLNFYYKIII